MASSRPLFRSEAEGAHRREVFRVHQPDQDLWHSLRWLHPIVENLKAVYNLEYAHQQDYEDNPARFNVDYWLTEAGLDTYGVTLKGAMEELGSDKGIGFTTPLSTLHAFQGWADLFLATPRRASATSMEQSKPLSVGIDLMAVYHEFSDDTGSLDYDHEIDLLAEKKFGKHNSVPLKFADFSNAPYSRNVLKLPDTQKFWIQGGINF